MVQEFHLPRLVISAPQGRSGKTTITLGLLSVLTRMGLKVQPFKKGPDYIDPSWHTKVTTRACRNLDCYMMEESVLKRSFIMSSQNCHISIIEGAMGLYDGLDLEGSGSTAQIAKILKAPVVLVVDTRRMTRSVAAMIMGFRNFDKEVNIVGVILNHVARARHEKMLRAAIAKYCDIPVIGCMPKDKEFIIPDRHLGLIPAAENEKYHTALDRIGRAVEENLDLQLLLKIAQNAAPLLEELDDIQLSVPEKKVKIGVINDRVFTFYYPENIEALEEKGAELVYINSLVDPHLPDIDGLYIGGGFPEVFARELEANQSLRKDIKNKAEKGLPIYAECGGLMYLANRILTMEGGYAMVGIFPFDIKMEDNPQGHGYTKSKVVGHNPYFQKDILVKGHEFHNSKICGLDIGNYSFAFKVERGYGINGTADGLVYKNVLASYNHLHALSVPEWAEGFVAAAKNWRNLYNQLS
ncbi:MAG: cobyrinate a,c-diamide synthase [Bacillota bacterium]